VRNPVTIEIPRWLFLAGWVLIGLLLVLVFTFVMFGIGGTGGSGVD
jgi:hypothetical protein